MKGNRIAERITVPTKAVRRLALRGYSPSALRPDVPGVIGHTRLPWITVSKGRVK